MSLFDGLSSFVDFNQSGAQGQTAPMAPTAMVPTQPATPPTNPQSTDLEWDIPTLIAAAIEGGASGFFGRQSQTPALLMQQQRDKQANILAQQKADREEEKAAMDQIKTIFSVVDKFDDKDAAAKFVKAAVSASPYLSKRYGEMLNDSAMSLKIGEKNDIVVERSFADNEIVGPDGKPLPAGNYKLTFGPNSFVPGQPMPIPRRIETGKPQSKEDEVKTGDRIFVLAAQSKHPNDPVKQAEEIRRLRNNPESVVNILGKYLIDKNSPGGKEDPAMENAIRDYSSMIGTQSKSRAVGSEEGRLQVRSSEPYQQTEEDIATRRAEGGSLGRPLESGVQTAITAMQDAVRVAKELKSEFTPQERAKYVGFLNYPARRIGQIVNQDKRFAKFQTLVARAKAGAFGEGGKQLTPFEASVVFGFVPTGTEFSAADFEAKLGETLSRSQNIIDNRIKLGTTPRGKLSAESVGGTSAGNVMRGKSKSGKPIVSRDGGKTWEYE